jgi:4-azaleucine resistance transporter AzlC
MATAVPIILGYLPVGFAFGVLSQKAGLSDGNTLLLSLLVYAGSSQLIALSLFSTGAPAFSIILTTFVVNLRHLLMSAAIAPYFARWRKPAIAAFAFQLTDETFALHSARFPQGVPAKAEIFGVNITVQVGWIFGTWLGLTAGQVVPEVEPLGLDYALPAMFLALLVLIIQDRAQLFIALTAGALAVIFLLSGLDRWNVILAALLAATLGVGMEAWINKRSS